MEKFVQLTLTGITNGAILAMVALGFVLIYKSSDIINFAQGELLMVGAYLVYVLIEGLGLWWPLAILPVATLAAFTLFRSMFWRQCKHQFFHLWWYAKYNLGMLAHRDNWALFPKLIREGNLRGLVEALLWDNPVSSGIFRHIPCNRLR